MNNDNDGQSLDAWPNQPPAKLSLPLRVPTLQFDLRALLTRLQVQRIELDGGTPLVRAGRKKRQRSQLLYFELYDRAPVGYCLLDADGTVRHANHTAASLLGVLPGQLWHQPIRRFIHDAELDIFHRHIQQLLESCEGRSCDVRMKKQDGSLFWAHLRSIRAQDTRARRLYLTVFGDITASKRAEEALRQQKEFFHQIAEHLSDFIAVLDLDGRRIYNSPSYQQFFGPSKNLLHTDSFADIHPDDRERVRQVFRDTVNSGRGHHIEYRFRLPDGRIRDMESQGSVIRDDAGRVTKLLIVAHDITERKRLQEQVQQMAFHDALTGLPNRRLLNDRLGHALAVCARSACHGALMFLDLDNFKPLNDAFGHDVGDLLLVETARRLRSALREVDTVARFGGDEFVVMLQLDPDEEASRAYAGRVAEKLRLALAEVYRLPVCPDPQREQGIEHHCSASIGVTLFNDRHSDSACVIKRADLAMYEAKQAGGNQVRFL